MPPQTPGYPDSCRDPGVGLTGWIQRVMGAQGFPKFVPWDAWSCQVLCKGSAPRPIWEAPSWCLRPSYSFALRTPSSEALGSPEVTCA